MGRIEIYPAGIVIEGPNLRFERTRAILFIAIHQALMRRVYAGAISPEMAAKRAAVWKHRLFPNWHTRLAGAWDSLSLIKDEFPSYFD